MIQFCRLKIISFFYCMGRAMNIIVELVSLSGYADELT